MAGFPVQLGYMPYDHDAELVCASHFAWLRERPKHEHAAYLPFTIINLPTKSDNMPECLGDNFSHLVSKMNGNSE